MKKNIICLLTLLIIGVSCTSSSSKQPKSSEKKIKFSEIFFDSIHFTVPQTSYNIASGIINDSIYCFDKVLDYLYSVSLDGKVGTKQMGFGNGKGEIPIKSPDLCYNKGKNSFVAFGTNNDIYLYDVSNKKTSKIELKPCEETMSYKKATSYTLWDEILLASNDNNLYYNILGDSEDVSLFDNEDYFGKGAILMKIDLKKGTMTPVGNYPSFYNENRNKLRHLSHIYFDINDKGDIYTSFQADSLIYHYDCEFNLKESFGYSASEMNTNYTDSGCGVEQVGNAFYKDTETVGYYYWMKYVDGYIFRSYRTSFDAAEDGLQVYEGSTLIADIKVPKNLKVIGKVGDYFVTEIFCDETNEKLGFCRFKLN